MMKKYLKFIFLAMPVAVTAQFSTNVAPVPADLRKGFDSINVADAQRYLAYLAGPECEGRGTGQPGYQKACDYMAAQFKKMGLKSVMPDGSYFQYNDFWRTRVDPQSLEASISGNQIPQSELNLISAGNADVSGTGLLLVSPKGTVEGLESALTGLKGKIVFLYNPTGGRAVERALRNSEARAVVLLQKEVAEPGWTGRSRQPAPDQTGTPRFAVSESAFWKTMGEPMSKSVSDFVASSSLGKRWILSSNVVLKGKQQVEKIKVANVVAKLDGSDPNLKDEYVAVGAHLDHLGRTGNTIYYGADDDGSGSTALLQLADALVKNPIKPKRGVMFMAFYGEEMGLLGSRFLADNCPLPLNNMFAELQMDMVGRNSSGAQNGDPKRMDKEEENRDSMRLVGSKRISTKLDDIIQDSNRHIGFKFKYDSEDVYTRSDHYAFASKGVPVAFFFSGFHPDYHQPTDTIEKINYDKIVNTVKLNYLIIHKLGEHQGRLPKIN